MSYTSKLYSILAQRRAFVEGATQGKFGQNIIQAQKAAVARYPIPTPKVGELAEIAEARRVPTPDFAPRNSEGEDKPF